MVRSCFLIVFALTFLAQNAHAKHLASFSDIQEYLSLNPESSLDQVIQQLSPDLRKNYSLVYETRNTAMSASKLKPRVILTNSDASLMLAFAGSSEEKGGHQLEVIERTAKDKPYEFRRIDFSKAAAERIDHSPASCKGCHQMADGHLGLKPIWDTYPDWPGFYGSSHSGEVTGNIFSGQKVVGTSGLPVFDFEKNAYRDFQKSALQSPRYAALPGIQTRSLLELAENNTLATRRIATANFTRLTEFLKAKNLTLEDAIKLDQVLNQGKRIYPASSKRAEIGSAAYLESKRQRVFDIVNRLGSAEDRRLVAQHGLPYASFDADTMIGIKKRKIAAMVKLDQSSAYWSNVESFLKKDYGIDIGDLSFTKEMESFSFTTGYSNNHYTTTQGNDIRLMVLAQFKKELDHAGSKEEYITLLQKMAQSSVEESKEFAPHLPKFLKTLNGLDGMNEVLNNPAIRNSVRHFMIWPSLQASKNSVQQYNFLLNHPLLTIEQKKGILQLAFASDGLSLDELKQIKLPKIKDSFYSSKDEYHKAIANRSNQAYACYFSFKNILTQFITKKP